jgi:hypothetical protein
MVTMDNSLRETERVAMPHELKELFKFGGAALVASGILFVLVALLGLRTGPPPSTGADILFSRDSQAFVLSFVRE